MFDKILWRTSMKKVLKTTGTVFTVLVLTLTVLTMRSGLWMLDTWTNLTMNELIFHLKAPMDGTNEELISGFITACLLVSLVPGLFFAFLLFLTRKNKLLYRILHLAAWIASSVIILLTLQHVWNNLEVTDYVESQVTYSNFIDMNYVSPENVQITFPQEKRNLIHIYLESMETTFTDKAHGGAFSENVIPEITNLAQEHEDFSGLNTLINGAISLSGTSWTMGALFGQTSGLPLLLPIDGNAMSGQSTFMPNLITIGDILEDAGYRQAFLIGSDASFGGRELYFKEHGNYKMWDYDYFQIDGKIPEDYYVWWGFEDKYLMEFVKEKLTWLSAQPEPFNLTMLTVDTHFEDGYVCSDCKTYYENDQYSNVIRCSSQKIGELIAWIKQQDFYENTTIVITGDHPTMDGNYCSFVPSDYQRKVSTIYINAPLRPSTSTYRTYSTFDIFPTTLASLGVSIEGERLALGTNLFSSMPTLCEEYGTDYVDKEISKKSELMEELTSDITYADASIMMDKYKPLAGTFDVLVNEMDYSVDIMDIRCLVWTAEDKSDARWYILPYSEDESYTFTIPVTDFSASGTIYNVEIFAYAKNTIMYSLGTNFIDISK